MSEYYHVVPWYNSEEWLKVYDDISNTSSNKEYALKVLLVWKARCPSLLSGIESTLSLLQVSIEDLKLSDDVANDQLIRLAYSSAIMRFVNHMLDTETGKGTSLYQAAKTLGVPDWIIDLRHDTAHSNTLPPLTLLREACAISLQWLQTNYWDEYKKYIQDYVSGQKNDCSDDKNKIAALINYCVSISICAHSQMKIKNLSELPNMSMKESIVNDTKELLGDHIDLSNLKTVSIMSLINTLNTHSQRLLKVRDVTTHVNEALLGEDSIFLSRDLLYFFSASDFKYRNKLYSSYVQCFEVLLTFLHTNDLLLEFILALIRVSQCEQSTHSKARLAAFWVSEILVALKKSQKFIQAYKSMSAAGKKPKRKDLRQLYHHWFPSDTRDNLLLDLQKPVPQELEDINFIQPILAAYNPFLIYFVKSLLDLLNPSIPSPVVERVCALAKVISSPDEFPMSSSSKIYTAEDILKVNVDDDDIQIIENDQNNDIKQTEEENNQELIINGIWKLASKEYDWSTCPVGNIPWLVSKDQEKHQQEEQLQDDNVVEMETNQV